MNKAIKKPAQEALQSIGILDVEWGAADMEGDKGFGYVITITAKSVLDGQVVQYVHTTARGGAIRLVRRVAGTQQELEVVEVKGLEKDRTDKRVKAAELQFTAWTGLTVQEVLETAERGGEGQG